MGFDLNVIKIKLHLKSSLTLNSSHVTPCISHIVLGFTALQWLDVQTSLVPCSLPHFYGFHRPILMDECEKSIFDIEIAGSWVFVALWTGFLPFALWTWSWNLVRCRALCKRQFFVVAFCHEKNMVTSHTANIFYDHKFSRTFVVREFRNQVL